MREEATIQEWKELYQLGIRFKEMQPWKKIRNDELIAVEFSQEETAYFTIMGIGERMYGFAMYQGLEGLNSLLGLWDRERLGIDEAYMTTEQDCIAMFISGREEVPEEQREVIRKLGLHFRGQHSWVYFVRHEKGYLPYILNRNEVQSCIRYLEKLLDALKCYDQEASRQRDHYDSHYVYGLDGGEWKGRFEEMPFNEFQMVRLKLADPEQIRMLQALKKTKDVWEVDCCPMSEGVSDEKYEKIVVPKQFLVMDHKKDVVLYQNLIMPEDGWETAAGKLGDLILGMGRPKEIIAPNVLIGRMIENMCEVCGIKLQVGDTPCCRNFQETFSASMGDIDEEQLLQGLEELGLDMGKLRKDASNMTQEEFVESIMGELGELFGSADWDDYDDYEYEMTEYDLKNRKQKVDVVKRFFGCDDNVCNEDQVKSIEGDWAYDWKELLMESSKKQLLDMAKEMGALVDRSYTKDLLADIIISMALKDSSVLLDLLTKDEQEMARYMVWDVEDMEAEWDIEDFPYTMEQVLCLLNLGLMDVGYVAGDMDQILQLKVVDSLRMFLK